MCALLESSGDFFCPLPPQLIFYVRPRPHQPPALVFRDQSRLYLFQPHMQASLTHLFQRSEGSWPASERPEEVCRCEVGSSRTRPEGFYSFPSHFPALIAFHTDRSGGVGGGCLFCFVLLKVALFLPLLYISAHVHDALTHAHFPETILSIFAEASRPDPPGFGSRHPKCQHESWS